MEQFGSETVAGGAAVDPAGHYRSTGQWRLCAEACRLARTDCGVGVGGDAPVRGRDRLFVHADVYRWRMANEESVCSCYVGAHGRGLELTDALLALPDLPPAIASNGRGNRCFYVPGPPGSV